MNKLIVLLTFMTLLNGCAKHSASEESTIEITSEISTDVTEKQMERTEELSETVTEEMETESTSAETTIAILEKFESGIYTSTEIVGWSNPINPIEKALQRIIKILKDKNEYYDAIEYLFDIELLNEETANYSVQIYQNFADHQVEVGKFEIEGGEVHSVPSN